VIDAQSVKASANVPAASQGYDAGKKIAGRKRSIVTDPSACRLRCWSPPPAHPTAPPASRC
jgi:hypothetical protein